MKNKLIIPVIALGCIWRASACSLMSSQGAAFFVDRIAVKVVIQGECLQAQTSSDQLLQEVEEAAEEYWNKIPTSRAKLVPGGQVAAASNVDYQTRKLCFVGEADNCSSSEGLTPVPGTVLIACNSNTANFNARTYAKTLLSYRGKTISSAVIFINNTPGNLYAGLSAAQKTWVIVHELGHALGLGHTEQSANVMYYTLTPDRTALGEEDALGLTYLYPQKVDGCGFLGTQKEQGRDGSINTNTTSWWLTLSCGILLSLLFFTFLRSRIVHTAAKIVF